MLARKNHKNRKIRKICEAKAVPAFPLSVVFITLQMAHHLRFSVERWRNGYNTAAAGRRHDELQNRTIRRRRRLCGLVRKWPAPPGKNVDTLRDLLGREKRGAAIDVKDVLLVDREAVKLFAL